MLSKRIFIVLAYLLAVLAVGVQGELCCEGREFDCMRFPSRSHCACLAGQTTAALPSNWHTRNVDRALCRPS
jgi:hypothetical protein